MTCKSVGSWGLSPLAPDKLRPWHLLNGISNSVTDCFVRPFRRHMFGGSMNLLTYSCRRCVKVFLAVCDGARRPAAQSTCSAGILYCTNIW